MDSKKNYPKSLVERAVIIKDPQKAITEYYQSKLEDQQIKKYPDWDIPKSGPEIELLKAYRELSQAENKLEAKRKEYDDKREHMDQQWANMRRKEIQLRESFINFDQFVKENHQKRERAQRKLAEEKERQEKCRVEIAELKEKLNYLTSVRNKMQEYVEKYKVAKNYLEQVVDDAGEFQSITDIFNRYESLMEARQALAKHQDKNLRQLEEIGIEMQQMTQEKEQKLINLNNQLANLQVEYDKAKAEVVKWENVVTKVKDTASEKILEIIRYQSVCWSLYTHICKRKGVPIEVSKDDIENQLIDIKRTILVLKDIVKDAEKRALEEEKCLKKK